LNPTLDMRFACGITSFLCLCVIILQLLVAANQDITARAVTAEIKLLRAELSKHNTETVDRLSTILVEMDLAHSAYKASK